MNTEHKKPILKAAKKSVAKKSVAKKTTKASASKKAIALKGDSAITARSESLYAEVAEILATARSQAYRAVNLVMVQAYWNIGRVIVEQEQGGQTRADYGERLIDELSKRLTANFGSGFNRSNVFYMRQFYLAFPIVHALRGQLSWTHYRLLLKVESDAARKFYEAETINSNWSTRQLERQIASLLYERLALSRDKESVLRLAQEGQELNEARDLIKDPFVFEFLGLSETTTMREKDLEAQLVERLQFFLLELGRGFAFVARQRRITIDNEHFYVDLVLYNYVLKCFVLIDLKVGRLAHGDIGQMDFYVRYFEKEVKASSDNPTIGLILCSDKREAMIKYTLLDDAKQIFASKYRLHLPTEAELEREITNQRARLETENSL